ncbi:T9SS sorting signal type C domain-containing protein [Psychroserpens sp.]
MLKKILFIIFFMALCNTSFAQAPGNICASAAPITLQYGTTVSTGMHTISNPAYNGNYGAINCNPFFGFYGAGRDGVYSIDVAVAGVYTFAFANNGNTWKSLSVHSACEPTLVNCVGGFATNGNRDGSSVPDPITLGIGTYYLVIDNWPPASTNPPTPGATSNITFELLITSPISNDDCANAVELFSEVDCSFVTYTNAGATGSVGPPAPTCANYLGGDVWFTYEVGASGEFTVTTEAGVMLDSGLAIYSGTCGTLSQLSCNDDFGGSGNMSSITLTGRTPGEILYIRLWEYGNNNNGTFGICITVPIPPGDSGVYSDCPNERGLELTSDFTCAPGANSATVVFGNIDGGPVANRLNTSVANITTCGFSGATGRYETINFTVPTTGLYVFEMTAASFDGQGYIVVNDGLFNPGSCATGTFVVGDDDSAPGAGLRPQLTINLTAGVNYTLITTEWTFGGPGSGNSPYTWTVTTGPPVNWLSTPPIEWYIAAVGGTPIETGPGFSPVNFPGSGLTDTSVPGIYPFWYECSSNPGVRTQVDYVIGKYWNGSTSTNWNTASNWYGNSVPTSSQCLYIPAGTPNDPVVPDDIDGDGLNLTIETGATLTLTSDGNANNFGSSLTIQDHINVQGTLTVQDNASLIQVNNTPSTANSGDIVVNRDADIRNLDYVYWSSPVQGFDVSNVYNVNTPVNRIYDWLPTTATGYLGMPGNVPIVVGNWSSMTSGAMNPAKGYAVRGPNNHTATVSAATAVFTGVPNNGVITQAINSGGYSAGSLLYNPYGADNLTATQLDDNWNLIGNPYPSALDANAFLMLPSNNIIEGSVHIWTHGTAIGNNGDSFYDDFVYTYSVADYIAYNISGSSYPDETFLGNIASGQGFFVLALNDNEAGSVTFNNDMRSNSQSNTEFYRTSSENQNITDPNALERNRIWLSLVNQNGASSNILVGYIEGATQEKDRLFDAFSREVNSLNIYSKIGDERMTIQGRALPFDENDQVPLGTVIPQPGEYTIAIDDVDGLFLDDSQAIYLEDTYNGVIHNLRSTPYTFIETEAIDYEDRFLLRYTADALSINDFELSTLTIIAPKGDYIKINSDSSPIDTVTVYDLLGRTLINKINIDNSEFVINDHNLSSGAYIVNVSLSNGLSKTQKVVLKR